MAFIRFAKVDPGSYFYARDETWVKTHGISEIGGERFNAYCPNSDGAEPDMSTKISLFYDETLVQPDPDCRKANWTKVVEFPKGGK